VFSSTSGTFSGHPSALDGLSQFPEKYTNDLLKYEDRMNKNKKRGPHFFTAFGIGFDNQQSYSCYGARYFPFPSLSFTFLCVAGRYDASRCGASPSNDTVK